MLLLALGLFSVVAIGIRATVVYSAHQTEDTRVFSFAIAQVADDSNSIAQAWQIYREAERARFDKDYQAALKKYRIIEERFGKAIAIDPNGIMDPRPFSALVRPRIAKLTCIVDRGEGEKFVSLEDLVVAVREAALSKRADLLMDYAGCGFTVFKPESDVSAFVSNDTFFKGFVEIAPDIDWHDVARRVEQVDDKARNVWLKAQNQSGSGTHSLRLRQTKEGWLWTGFASNDPQILSMVRNAESGAP